MVSKEEQLPVSRQCQLLNVPRSSYYYIPTPVCDEELALMRLIDKCYLDLPFYGTRRIKGWLLDNHGLVINRKRIQRLRRLMAIETLYPKRSLSLANKQHKVYPYLLRELNINRPNQVWGYRYHLYSHGKRLCLSGRCHGLVFTPSTVLARIDHNGCRLLY